MHKSIVIMNHWSRKKHSAGFSMLHRRNSKKWNKIFKF